MICFLMLQKLLSLATLLVSQDSFSYHQIKLTYKKIMMMITCRFGKAIANTDGTFLWFRKRQHLLRKKLHVHREFLWVAELQKAHLFPDKWPQNFRRSSLPWKGSSKPRNNLHSMFIIIIILKCILLWLLLLLHIVNIISLLLLLILWLFLFHFSALLRCKWHRINGTDVIQCILW